MNPMGLLPGTVLVLLAGAAMIVEERTAKASVRALSLESLTRFGRTVDAKTGAVEYASVPIDPGMDWNELVLSWESDSKATLDFQVRAIWDDQASPYYRLGSWNAAPIAFGQAEGQRNSINGQDDAWGTVETDTLVMKRPARRLEVRVIARGDGAERAFREIHLSFRNAELKPAQRSPERRAWGRLIDAPQRAQSSYENGNVICSPTSTSMVLAHWAKRTGNSALDRDVPDVVKGVYDPAWKGTGNWVFNTAFAASLGLNAKVLRLQDLRDLETLIAADLPVICSVSYALLKGKPAREPNDGHIVVLLGFTREGDPIFNDPGRNQVRQTYAREAFQRAWESSGRTVYLIYPEDMRRPKLSVDER